MIGCGFFVIYAVAVQVCQLHRLLVFTGDGGAVFHIPHGRANAMLLPWIIEYNSNINIGSRSRQIYEPCVRKYCNIAGHLGLHGSNEIMTIHSLANYVRFMADEMSIPMQLREILSVSKEEYESKQKCEDGHKRRQG